jgi:hypothetical protein
MPNNFVLDNIFGDTIKNEKEVCVLNYVNVASEK